MPATNWQEKIDPGETERFERYAGQLRELQRKNARGGAPARALHAKGQLGLEARLTVLPDLPEHARVGPFAAPATFRAYVRYSNGSGIRQHDAKADVRGIAVKLLGVAGKKLIPGMEDAKTQDFLMIRSPSTPFRTADEFVPFVMAASSPLTALPKLIVRFGFGRTLAVLKKLSALGEPMGSLAETRYFTALPLQFGKHAVRCALTPVAPKGPPLAKSADMLADELAQRLRKAPVEYDFQLQFFEDEARTPIEDASVDWDAPWLTVARLTLPVQEVKSERGLRVAELVEKLSFDPWHALVELKPLGNMMRARNPAYRVSTQERKAAPEPDGTELA
ncbi:MAG: hypothetical protein ACXWLM_05150 [Myxococcales bacterium]